MVGRRLPFLAKYKAVASGKTGKLKSVGIKIYCDCGYNFNTPTVDTAKAFAKVKSEALEALKARQMKEQAKNEALASEIKAMVKKYQREA